MGTYEKKVAADQLWVLKKSTYYTKADWYYIYNAKYNGYRIGKWGSGDRDVGIWNGNYADDQLWKFEPYGNKANNVYIIKNKKYGTAFILSLTLCYLGFGDVYSASL